MKNRITNNLAARQRIYKREAKAFLDQYPWCEWFLRQDPPQKVRADSVHHQRGRRRTLLNDKRFWLPTSNEGHDQIHNHQPEKARQLGLLCIKGQYDMPVDEDGYMRNGVKAEFPTLSEENLKYTEHL